MEKFFYALILFFVTLSVATGYSQANEEIYESKDNQEIKSNVTYPKKVGSDMLDVSYWVNKLGREADKLLLNSSEIESINQDIIAGEGTRVNDIIAITEEMTQSERKRFLIKEVEDDFDYMVRDYPNKDRKLYVDGELINNLPYFENIKESILTTGFENDNEKIQFYSVATKRTEVKKFPTKAIWGYDSPNDPDDESCDTTLEVNEPFVIRAKCSIGDDMFYWGLSNSYTGWVNAKYLALFDTKEAWLEAWKVNVAGKDFLVVTQDNITLEPSTSAPETSEVQLKIGTVLKLVPKSELPERVNERATWNNYVVYLPTRNEEGKYVRSYALIPDRYNVSIGYLPLTQKNILNVAFSCLGNRYGWGGMLGSMDCSAYTKAICKCFGLDIPRDSDPQERIPNIIANLGNMTDEEKEAYIEKLPVGTPLYFPGHAMIYLGSENGVNYVISDTGSLSDTDGDLNVRSMYSVIINPLTVRRRNGNTWLKCLTSALVFGEMPYNEESVLGGNKQDVYATVDEQIQKGNITYSNGITSDMTKPSYWKELLNEKNKQLLNADEIQNLNTKINGENNVDLKAKDILVVTQDRIVLEPSIFEPETSEAELPMGTVLKLVPEDKIPTNLAERGPWYNHVIYLPVTTGNGEIEKKYALIPVHYNVSIGYLPLTSENIIESSLRCLGNSYELIDNTAFITSVYKCFGIELSFDSDINNILKDKIIEFSTLTIDEKKEKLKDIPVGSILRTENEYAIYLGTQNGNYYIISSKNGKANSIVLSRVELENITSMIDFTQNVDKCSLENVDDWAKKEMTKAEKKGLIPETFAKKDATKAISRLDFAAVVVKLYEVISGKKVETIVNNPFTDTNDEYVLKAYSLGIINGTSETAFTPNAEITREQMATVLTRTLTKAGIDTTVELEKVTKYADDIELNDWGKPSVYFMANKDIVKGVGGNRFNGLGNAKIEEALAIALRSVEVYSK